MIIYGIWTNEDMSYGAFYTTRDLARQALWFYYKETYTKAGFVEQRRAKKELLETNAISDVGCIDAIEVLDKIIE